MSSESLVVMESVEEYLADLDLPHSYEIDGEEAPLEEFDGVAYPLETGEEVFLEWNLHPENDYHVTLSEDTPGMVETLSLEELETKLLTGEYTPVQRRNQGYRKANYR